LENSLIVQNHNPENTESLVETYKNNVKVIASAHIQNQLNIQTPKTSIQNAIDLNPTHKLCALKHSHAYPKSLMSLYSQICVNSTKNTVLSSENIKTYYIDIIVIGMDDKNYNIQCDSSKI
jgi:hypothetical protein